jgi:hypothetical protein
MATPKPLEQQVAELAAIVSEQGKVLDAIRAVFTGSGSGTANVASDRDLDSEHGDEKVRMNPREWKGAPRKGWQMSRCEPEFLDLYQDTMEYFAGKNTDAKKAGYDRRSAARARGWAKRLRSGWQPAAGAPAAPQRDAWGRPTATSTQAAGSTGPAFDGFAPSSGAAGQGDAGAGDDEIPF